MQTFLIKRHSQAWYDPLRRTFIDPLTNQTVVQKSIDIDSTDDDEARGYSSFSSDDSDDNPGALRQHDALDVHNRRVYIAASRAKRRTQREHESAIAAEIEARTAAAAAAAERDALESSDADDEEYLKAWQRAQASTSSDSSVDRNDKVVSAEEDDSEETSAALDASAAAALALARDQREHTEARRLDLARISATLDGVFYKQPRVDAAWRAWCSGTAWHTFAQRHCTLDATPSWAPSELAPNALLADVRAFWVALRRQLDARRGCESESAATHGDGLRRAVRYGVSWREEHSADAVGESVGWWKIERPIAPLDVQRLAPDARDWVRIYQHGISALIRGGSNYKCLRASLEATADDPSSGSGSIACTVVVQWTSPEGQLEKFEDDRVEVLRAWQSWTEVESDDRRFARYLEEMRTGRHELAAAPSSSSSDDDEVDGNHETTESSLLSPPPSSSDDGNEPARAWGRSNAPRPPKEPAALRWATEGSLRWATKMRVKKLIARTAAQPSASKKASERRRCEKREKRRRARCVAAERELRQSNSPRTTAAMQAKKL